jgi:myosin heavy subunit
MRSIPILGVPAANMWEHMNDSMERVTGTGDLMMRQISRFPKVISEAESPTNLFAQAMKELSDDTEESNSELKDFRDELLEVKKSLTDVMDVHFGLEEAQDQVTESTRELAAQIKEQREEGVKGAGSLTGMTDAAIANREKVRDLAREYAELIFQEQQAGRSTEKLQGKFENTLVSMGFSRAEARKYARELANVKRAMDAIRSKEVTLRLNIEQSRSFGGGFLEFQHGGETPAHEPFRVHAGEVMFSDRSHYVATKSQVDSMANKASSGGGMRAHPITLSGSALMDRLITDLDAELRRRGLRLAAVSN